MQVLRLDIDNPDVCLQIFRANRNTGMMVGIALHAWHVY